MLDKLKLKSALLALLILANYLVWAAVSEATSSTLKIDVLDVGQGDAILIRTPTHQNILVDGGPDDQVMTELGKLLPLWDRQIDLIVATHPEADHISGLLTVLQRYRVKEVLTPRVSSQTKTYVEWQQVLIKVPLINYADATDDYEWGDVVWDTLLPLADIPISSSSSTNESSIVARLNYRQFHILFTGDMGPVSEALALRIYPALDSQILKVAHHGSKFSSAANWLQSIRPEVAIISVGEGNSYGHPSREALSRLQQVGANIYRTDQDGTIEVIFKDNGYWVKVNGKKEFYPHS